MPDFNCWICRDEGIIFYKKNGYEYACACTCAKGVLVSREVPSIEVVSNPKQFALKNYLTVLKSKDPKKFDQLMANRGKKGKVVLLYERN